MQFELPAGGHALFTTRADGNLSTMRGDGHEHGVRERERLCGELGLRWLCAGPQIHGNAVHHVDVRQREGGQPAAVAADGRVTGLVGVGVMVLSADCLPVIIGSESAVAALHAGWRGLAAGILEQGVHALRELGRASGGDSASEISALIGPGAGPCCYEVGPEVHSAFAGAHRRRRNLDLSALACERLAGAGVTRIECVEACTICDERFFSHRREGARAGRQAGIAWLT